MASGVTGKGMVAVAGPGTGHGAHQACLHVLKPDGWTPNEPARNRGAFMSVNDVKVNESLQATWLPAVF